LLSCGSPGTLKQAQEITSAESEQAAGAKASRSSSVIFRERVSFAEIQAALPKAGVEAVVVRGGFPELYANPDIDSVAFYNSYLATYLERDVRSLTNVGSLRDFERFLRACALRSANLLNKADLARDVGIAPFHCKPLVIHARSLWSDRVA